MLVDRFDGHKHGKGKLEYVNGDVYDGDWVMDTWHGKAKFVNGRGDVYEGGALSPHLGRLRFNIFRVPQQQEKRFRQDRLLHNRRLL